MTDKSREHEKNSQGLRVGKLSPFHINAERCCAGLCLQIGGVVGIEDFSDESVTLCSHGGRVFVSGKRLSLCVYEDNTVEISGRVEEVRFGYGKN